MTRSSMPFRILSTIVLTLTFAALAHAQVQRTFVSAQRGNDANTASLCSVTNPCRGFAAAISVVASGGEVIALDSGGYGAVNITKAVQITAPTGVYVAITASSGNAVTINAGTSDIVVLRGLTLNSVDLSASGGGTGGSNGIDFNTGKRLFVESCVINGFLLNGILFDAAGELSVKDTIVRNTVQFDGIILYTGSGGITAVIDHCRVEGSGRHGFGVGNKADAIISNSVAASNSRAGFITDGSGDLTVSNSTAANNSDFGFGAATGGQMNVESCIAKGNGNIGMLASGTGAAMRVSNSMAANNSYGFYQASSALFESRGNNTTRGNANNTFGTITIFSGN